MSERVFHPKGGEVRTKQSDAAGSDINGLLSRYVAQGGLPPQTGLRYGDFSNGDDYMAAAVRVQELEAQFRRLPTAVRKYCQNDPAVFLDLVFNPDRVGELVKLGLVKEEVPDGATVAKSAISDGAASAATPTEGSQGV